MRKSIQMMYDLFKDTCPVDQFVFTFRSLCVPVEAAEKSMRLFADEVLPFVHELRAAEPILITE
jgi:hypothetical protein